MLAKTKQREWALSANIDARIFPLFSIYSISSIHIVHKCLTHYDDICMCYICELLKLLLWRQMKKTSLCVLSLKMSIQHDTSFIKRCYTIDCRRVHTRQGDLKSSVIVFLWLYSDLHDIPKWCIQRTGLSAGDCDCLVCPLVCLTHTQFCFHWDSHKETFNVLRKTLPETYYISPEGWTMVPQSKHGNILISEMVRQTKTTNAPPST